MYVVTRTLEHKSDGLEDVEIVGVFDTAYRAVKGMLNRMATQGEEGSDPFELVGFIEEGKPGGVGTSVKSSDDRFLISYDFHHFILNEGKAN